MGEVVEVRMDHPAGRLFRVLLVLRCCSCRFTAYYWIGFCAGLAAVGRLSPLLAMYAVPLWLAYCLGTEAVNRLADREADKINRPERTELCELVGWGALRGVAIGSWLIFASLGAGLLWLYPNAALALWLLISAGIAIGYSVGPAFKRHRVLSLIALCTPVVAPMFTGWATGADPHALMHVVLPTTGVLALFSLGLSGIKDITDIAGDRAINYSSLWLALLTSRRGIAVYIAICLPALAAVLAVVFTDLPVGALGVVPCVLFSAVVVLAAGRANSEAERGVAREVMHTYTLCYLALLSLLAVPTGGMAVVVPVGVAYWALASRWLHWSFVLDGAGLRRWWAVLIRS